MSVIDRVKTHFETLKTITIEVNEWKDEHGNLGTGQAQDSAFTIWLLRPNHYAHKIHTMLNFLYFVEENKKTY